MSFPPEKNRIEGPYGLSHEGDGAKQDLIGSPCVRHPIRDRVVFSLDIAANIVLVLIFIVVVVVIVVVVGTILMNIIIVVVVVVICLFVHCEQDDETNRCRSFRCVL